MKTTNIIISAFAVFVIGSILTLFILAKQHDAKTIHKQMPKETFQLQPFSAVVACEGADIHLIQEEKSQIVVEDVEGKIKPDTLYEIKNDTLYVFGGYRAFVSCKDVKSITSRNVFWMGVSKFETDYLELNMTGEVQLNFGSENETSSIQLLEINAKKSRGVNFYNLDVGRANITLIDSYCIFNQPCDSIAASLKNSTFFYRTNNFEWLEIKKDGKSRVNGL